LVPPTRIPATWRVIRPELTDKQPTPLRPTVRVESLYGAPKATA
jgi:hypothetical protein